MICRLYVSATILLLLPNYSRGWSLLSSPSSPLSKITMTTQHKNNNNDDDGAIGGGGGLSRGDAIKSMTTKLIMIGSGVSAIGFGNVPTANADVTNKVASTAAIRILQRAKLQLPIKVFPYIEQKDFQNIKGALRLPPFDSIRKYASVLVRGGEDLGSQAIELENSYKILIQALEKLDNTSSLGMRGSKISSIRMKEEYDTFVLALDSFLTLGQVTAQVPVQEQTLQEQLQIQQQEQQQTIQERVAATATATSTDNVPPAADVVVATTTAPVTVTATAAPPTYNNNASTISSANNIDTELAAARERIAEMEGRLSKISNISQ